MLQLKVMSHAYDTITKWTVSRDGRIFAFCVESDVIVYLITTQVCTCCEPTLALLVPVRVRMCCA